MLSNCERPGIGAVGAKLYYPDNTIQHAGIIIGIGGIAGHAFLNLPRARSGYLHKASLQMNVSAVTAACMMVSRKIFDLVGGFEETLSVAFNDVTYAFASRKPEYHNVYNPHVNVSVTSQNQEEPKTAEAKARRFQNEKSIVIAY